MQSKSTLSHTDPRFMAILGTLGPRTVAEWRRADKVGRVSIALMIAGAIRRKMGDEPAHEAFRVLFAVATS